MDVAREGHAGDEAAGVQAEFGVTNIQDVWIFTHERTSSYLAPLSGIAMIRDNYLRVGDRLVVWSVENKSLAEGLVKAILAGESPKVESVGGSERSVPAHVQERCPTQYVFVEGHPGAQ